MILHPTLKLKEIAEMTEVSSEGVLRVWRTKEAFKKAIQDACKRFGDEIANHIEIVMHGDEIDKIKHLQAPGIVTGDVLKILRSKQELGGLIKGKYSDKVKKVFILDDLTDYPDLPEPYREDPDTFILLMLRLLPFLNPSVATPLKESLKENLENQVRGYLDIYIGLSQAMHVCDEETLREWSRGFKEITKAFIKSGFDLLANPKAWEELGVEKMQKIAQDLKEFTVDEIDILTG